MPDTPSQRRLARRRRSSISQPYSSDYDEFKRLYFEGRELGDPERAPVWAMDLAGQIAEVRHDVADVVTVVDTNRDYLFGYDTPQGRRQGAIADLASQIGELLSGQANGVRLNRDAMTALKHELLEPIDAQGKRLTEIAERSEKRRLAVSDGLKIGMPPAVVVAAIDVILRATGH